MITLKASQKQKAAWLVFNEPVYSDHKALRCWSVIDMMLLIPSGNINKLYAGIQYKSLNIRQPCEWLASFFSFVARGNINSNLLSGFHKEKRRKESFALDLLHEGSDKQMLYMTLNIFFQIVLVVYSDLATFPLTIWNLLHIPVVFNQCYLFRKTSTCYYLLGRPWNSRVSNNIKRNLLSSASCSQFLGNSEFSPSRVYFSTKSSVLHFNYKHKLIFSLSFKCR